MAKNKPLFLRGSALVLTAALAVASIVPAVLMGTANAGTLSARSIAMSDSTPGATNVTYSVTITPEQSGAHNVSGFVLEFCDNTPIDGDACEAAAGGAVTAGVDVPDGTAAALAGWVLDGSSTANELVFTRGAANWTGGTPVTLNITGIENPSNVNAAGTFYAKAYSYNLSATAQAYDDTTPGTYIDFGGFALSTATNLTVTAKVHERINFCVYTTSCGVGSAVTLGDSNGVLDPAHDYSSTEGNFSISTNAGSGAAIVMKGTTLKSGSNYIAPVASETAFNTGHGSEQFGICLWESSGSGLTPAAAFNGAVAAATTECSSIGAGGVDAIGATSLLNFGVADDTATSQTIATKLAGDASEATIAMAANIANSTEAGVYQTNLMFIATGTY
jgi:hypothetical protein